MEHQQTDLIRPDQNRQHGGGPIAAVVAPASSRLLSLDHIAAGKEQSMLNGENDDHKGALPPDLFITKAAREAWSQGRSNDTLAIRAVKDEIAAFNHHWGEDSYTNLRRSRQGDVTVGCYGLSVSGIKEYLRDHSSVEADALNGFLNTLEARGQVKVADLQKYLPGEFQEAVASWLIQKNALATAYRDSDGDLAGLNIPKLMRSMLHGRHVTRREILDYYRKDLDYEVSDWQIKGSPALATVETLSSWRYPAPAEEHPENPDRVPPTRGQVMHYLWEVYKRTPAKVDSTGDFTWKDELAASRLGESLPQYVIGHMNPKFRLQLYEAGKAMDQDLGARHWSFLSGYRDESFRQAIASGFHAKVGHSNHGRGLAIDITGVTEDYRKKVLRWITDHGDKYKLRRPLPDKDPSHVQPLWVTTIETA
jgi:hypothetical protein